MLVGTDALGGRVELQAKDVATSGTAILAMRGAGKSWLNAVLAEGLAAARLPFVIVDPEGEYWTLKVQFPGVVVAGGDHADVPLALEIAETLAQVALEERLELVLDLSDLRREQQVQFLARFLEELFFRETEMRIPFWVSLEEADLWVPQTGNPPCKVPVLDVCQRGRKRGLGFALVSQRPATIDKTALSQAEYRFFKRFQQPHDLRAVAEYLGAFSDRTKILPALAVEETLLYAPARWKRPLKLRVAPRSTPHGGATPGQLALIKPTTTILSLRRRLEELLSHRRREQSQIEQLQNRIRELENQLAEKEEELRKLRLASDVASLLAQSAAPPAEGGKEKERSRTGTPQLQIFEGEALPPAEAPGVLVVSRLPPLLAEMLSREAVEPLGPVGVDVRTGLVLGSELAHLLLNRLAPEERVLLLALRRSDRPMAAKELARQTGFSLSKTRRLLPPLLRKGLLRQVGRNRHGLLYKIPSQLAQRKSQAPVASST